MKAIKTTTKKGTKTTTSITKGNIKTIKTKQGFMKITIATVTVDDVTIEYKIIKNGLAPAKYSIKRSDEVKTTKKVKQQVFKSDYDITTFKELRQTILDYAEAEKMDFFTALKEIMPYSHILNNGLNDYEIAIILDIPFEAVSKTFDMATKKLKMIDGMYEFRAEFKLNNKQPKRFNDITNSIELV